MSNDNKSNVTDISRPKKFIGCPINISEYIAGDNTTPEQAAEAIKPWLKRLFDHHRALSAETAP